MKPHPLARLALALVLTVQGFAVAAMPMQAAEPAATLDEAAAMPCHGDDTSAEVASPGDCCGSQCLCELLCGGAALPSLARATPALPPFTPVSSPRVPPAHAAFPDPRLRPPDAARS